MVLTDDYSLDRLVKANRVEVVVRVVFAVGMAVVMVAAAVLVLPFVPLLLIRAVWQRIGPQERREY